MKRFLSSTFLLLTATALTVLLANPANSRTLHHPAIAPEFTHTAAADWLNSKPLQLQALLGKVVLIDFWTFACWNCYRSFPWLNAMEKRLKKIAAKIKEFELQHPVMIDNDFSYWRAMGNRYWPAYYLIDKKGAIRATFVGETHAGDQQARRIEKTIEQLLAESA